MRWKSGAAAVVVGVQVEQGSTKIGELGLHIVLTVVRVEAAARVRGAPSWAPRG